MPWWLDLCDLGILAGADPWFPHSDVLHSLDGMAMWFCVFVFSFVCFCHTNTWVDTMLSPHLIISLLNWTADHFLTLLVFGCFVWFACFCVIVVAFGVVWLFAVFLQWIVTATGLCTGPIPVHFVAPYLMAALCMHQLGNLPVLCMQLNVWNDLAKAKALDGKWMRISPEMDQFGAR